MKEQRMAEVRYSKAAEKQKAVVVVVMVLLIIFPAAYGQLPGITWPIASGQDVQRIAMDLRKAGFSLAGMTIRALGSFIPAYTTLMIPTNAAIASIIALNSTAVPATLLYHAITQVLPFSFLLQFPVGQKMPTLLAGSTVVVSNNTAQNFTINDAKIVKRNICGNSKVISCHGIDRVLIPPSLAGKALASSPLAAPQFAPQFAPMLAPGSSAAPPESSQVVIPGNLISPGAAPVAVIIHHTSQDSIPNSAFSLWNILHPHFSFIFLTSAWLFYHSVIC